MSTIKGEVPFQADGETFKLVYDFNALCTIEDQLGLDIDSIGGRLNSPKMIRSVFRVGLQAHHGDLTDLEAGNLIHKIGAQAAAETIAKAFQAAFPEASGEGKAPAKKPRSGTSRGR